MIRECTRVRPNRTAATLTNRYFEILRYMKSRDEREHTIGNKCSFDVRCCSTALDAGFDTFEAEYVHTRAVYEDATRR